MRKVDLSSDDFPVTEEGSNWTVVVFRCPRKNWTEVLRDLYSELDKQRLSLMPHYTIRFFDASTNSRARPHEGLPNTD